MTRAERRHRWDRAKRRAEKLWHRWNPPMSTQNRPYKCWSTANGYEFFTAADMARGIAHLAETHGRPCSCWMCAHHKSVPPKRERSFL